MSSTASSMRAAEAKAVQVVAHLSHATTKKRLTFAVLTPSTTTTSADSRAVLDAGILPKAVYVNDPRVGFAAFTKTATAECSKEADVRQINASVATSNTLLDIKRQKVPIRHAFRDQVIHLSKHLAIGILGPTRDEFPKASVALIGRNRDKLVEALTRTGELADPENRASGDLRGCHN